ncbi:hypothetical protein BU17DRAFT_104135 [Hysterangium stoloniferum]|nr:hypothetical protein BU17DRAFT_104135 [Hysterangium stoloniferum]
MSDQKVVPSHPDHVEELPQSDLSCFPGISTDRSPRKSFSGYTPGTCRGFAACIEPPQGLLESSVIEEGLSDFESDAMTRWAEPVIRNSTDVEVGPGYFCGLALERIGTKLLYDTEMSIVIGKCLYYTRRVEEYQRVAEMVVFAPEELTTTGLLDERLTVRQLSRIVQEGVDLLRHVRF